MLVRLGMQNDNFIVYKYSFSSTQQLTILVGKQNTNLFDNLICKKQSKKNWKQEIRENLFLFTTFFPQNSL